MSRKWFVPFITIVIVGALLLMQGNSDGRSLVRQAEDFLNYHGQLIGGLWAALRILIDPIITFVVLTILLLLPPFLVGTAFRFWIVPGIDALVQKKYQFEGWMIWTLQLVIFFFASILWVRFIPSFGALNPWFDGTLRAIGLSKPEIFPAFFFLITYALALIGCAFGGMLVGVRREE